MSIDYRGIGERRTVPKAWLTSGVCEGTTELSLYHREPRLRRALTPQGCRHHVGVRTGPKVAWLKLPLYGPCWGRSSFSTPGHKPKADL